MSIDTIDDLLDICANLMGESATLVSTDGQEQAANQALRELGWVIPQSDETKNYWIIERTKRHIMYVLLLEQAHKFRFKQIHLQQRFEHYIKMIDSMDETFKEFMELNPNLFPLSNMEGSVLGDFLDAGFVYDQLGRDLTYVTTD